MNNPKNLDPSKMELDFWDCFGREKKLIIELKKYNNSYETANA